MRRKPNWDLHIRVAERVLGKRLPKGVEIHHFDGNRNNNAHSNLVICPNKEYHALLHIRQRALEACGNADFRKCLFCKTYDAVENLKQGGRKEEGYWMHNLCNAKYQRGRRARAKTAIS